MLRSILVTLGFKLDLSRVCARFGLSTAAGERGIRKILLCEDCRAVSVNEVCLCVSEPRGELPCADQKLHLSFFEEESVFAGEERAVK